MSSGKQPSPAARGTAHAPHYYEEPPVIQDDVWLRVRFFAYQTHAGLVAGDNFSVLFSIDRPAKQVWRYFRDFNLWQSFHYSGVAGDLEGKPLRLSLKPNEPGPHQYVVRRVIPEHLIILDQPVPEPGYVGFPWWLGGVSAGFHAFMLNEVREKTTVSVLMNHASLMARTADAQGMTDEEAIRPWRGLVPEGIRLWRDDFIPTLKKLAYDGKD
jgi:hypothetical protein